MSARARSLSVRLVVACTDRKSAPAAVTLRTVRHLPLAERLRAWAGLLWARGAPDCLPVRDLYAGDHWAVARRVSDAPPAGVRVELWVCSAGAGLLGLDDAVRPYSATFAAGSPDSVVSADDADVRRGGEGAAARWWRGLGGLARRHRRGSPTTLAELAACAPGTPIAVAASPRYVDALLPDLLEARGRLRSPDLLTVFTSGRARSGVLGANVVVCDARLQSVADGAESSLLGGALTTLNVRAAARALATAGSTGLRAPAVAQYFARLAARQPAPRRYDRRRVEPAEVAAFVREALRRDPAATHTHLLRAFRASGRAFEYTRFRGIFREVVADTARDVTRGRAQGAAEGETPPSAVPPRTVLSSVAVA